MMQHHKKSHGVAEKNAGRCRGYKERVLRNHRFRETAIIHNCDTVYLESHKRNRKAEPKLFPDKSASNSATCEQSFSIVHSHYPQNCLHNAYAAATRTAQQPTPYAQRSLRQAANTQTTACQHENVIEKAFFQSPSHLLWHFQSRAITLRKFNIAIENCHRNSGFSHEKWWFSIAILT